jgi:hypothetical protein
MPENPSLCDDVKMRPLTPLKFVRLRMWDQVVDDESAAEIERLKGMGINIAVFSGRWMGS